MVKIGIEEYVDKYYLKGSTVEETMINFFEHIYENPNNRVHAGYRNELISAASIVVNGLSTIKKPQRLYVAMAKSFERRNDCIFTRTVARALSRTYGLSVKRGFEKYVLFETRKLKNDFTKSLVSKYLPKEDIIKLLKKQNSFLAQNIASLTYNRFDAKERAELEKFSSFKMGRSLYKMGQRNLSHLVPDNLNSATKKDAPLKGISGKRGQRKREMKRKTKHLKH
jgi:hypothetical protein